MGYAEKIKLALSYAEESSKRTRWIMFIMQMAVVLVAASLWQESHYNWAYLRLQANQRLVHSLICMPNELYTQNAEHVKSIQSSAGIESDPKSTPKSVPMSAPMSAPMSPLTSEYLDSQYRCGMPFAAIKQDSSHGANLESQSPEWVAASNKEYSDSRQFEMSNGWSLIEAKKNVADFQQIRNNRILAFTVPILGITFDVNDLSFVGSVTFVILISWLKFALKRQQKNVSYVFNFARQEKPEYHASSNKNFLKDAYDLLAMSQVLTTPPVNHKDIVSLGSHDNSRIRDYVKRILRLPSLIMWTAVGIQFVAIFYDYRTIFRGVALDKSVTYVEIISATLLSFYLFFRTYECFKVIKDTNELWVEAFIESHQDGKQNSKDGTDSLAATMSQ